MRPAFGPIATILLALASAGGAWGQPPPHPKPAAPPARKPAHSDHQAMTGWHAPGAQSAPVDASGRPLLVLRSLSRNDKVELTSATDAGGFSARDLDRAAWVLRSMSGDAYPVEPRTLGVIYRIQTHFEASEIRVVSGYRVPRGGSLSNHGRGRAIDFVVPGASDADVASFARGLGFVGVGVYPTSHFVHVDVRPQSYFWVDYSGPGKRNRERGILRDLAMASDRRALERGERGVEPFAIGVDVDVAASARAERAASDAPASGVDDDDDGETP